MSSQPIKKMGDGVKTVIFPAGASQDVNLAKVAGTATSVGAGAIDAGTQRVTVAENLPLPAIATGAAAIAFTTSIAAAFELISVTMHLSAAGTTPEDFTIGIDSASGAAYDTNVITEDLSVGSIVDVILTPKDGLPEKLKVGDELVFVWPNTEVRTYGLEVNYRLM